MKAILVCVVSVSLLAGCAGAIMSVNDLKEQGYRNSNIVGTTATGERRLQDKYEVWVKESHQSSRVAEFCLVPVVSNAGYQWAISVFVNDQQVWDHDGGYGLPNKAGRRTGIDCASSPPLPEGRMNWRVLFRYWQ